MINQNDYRDEPKFTAYVNALCSAGCAVHAITPLHILYKRNGEFLFGMFNVDATDTAGHKLLPYVVIRGNACVIVPLVRNRQSGEERYLMIRQRRTGSGLMSLEFPAGMLDREVNDPVGVARKELHEETGVETGREAFFPLWDKPLFTSVGLQDEAILYYGCTLEFDADEYAALNGRLTGEACEGEHIEVVLMSREQAQAEATSAQVLLGFALFDRTMKGRNK